MLTSEGNSDTIKKERSDKIIDWVKRNSTELNAAEAGNIEFNFINRTLKVRKEFFIKIV